MLTSIIDKVKVVGRNAFIADENNKVYVLKMGNNPFKYEIVLAENNNKNLVDETVIKEPTQEQREYALLNLIMLDNISNKNKTGIYYRDTEQICDEFVAMLYEIDHNKLSINDVLERFGLTPIGKFTENAYNSLIKDIINGRCENVENYRLEFAKRETKKVHLSQYHKSADGYIYLAKPNTFNLGLRIIQIRPSMELEVKNPTQSQLEDALLNVIVADNYTNPNKSGMYKSDTIQLKNDYIKTLVEIKNGKCDKKILFNKFGLDINNKYLERYVDLLTEKVVAGCKKIQVEEKTL